ncbi:MAG: Flp pilus assembly complex ATPase component TadA [Acidobacteria bacterium]|nr:Flp pilus assembly complex ATPase component TadA [Acidobacteriota bacterium]
MSAAPTELATFQPQNKAQQILQSFLYRTLDAKGSDLHLYPGTVPWVSRHGSTEPMQGVVADLSPSQLENILRGSVSADDWDVFIRNKRLEFAYVTERSRFRGHFAIENGSPYAVFREIANTVPEFEALGLPPIIESFIDYESGIFLFIGVTGSGKSSSLAALVKKAKNRYAKKIITLEAPIEYKHTNGKSLISQREVGENADVNSFALGIQDAMREAPDIMLIGEMRDPETMQAAISAATSGHLVFSTLHAESTADAPTRILDSMPEGRLGDVRAQLARSLRGIVYQKLLPKKGGEGRVVATEVLMMTPAIANMIRNNKLEQIGSQLHIKDEGHIPFEASLVNLVMDGYVNEATARRAELVPGSFDRQLRAGRWS